MRKTGAAQAGDRGGGSEEREAWINIYTVRRDNSEAVIKLLCHISFCYETALACKWSKRLPFPVDLICFMTVNRSELGKENKNTPLVFMSLLLGTRGPFSCCSAGGKSREISCSVGHGGLKSKGGTEKQICVVEHLKTHSNKIHRWKQNMLLWHFLMMEDLYKEN